MLQRRWTTRAACCLLLVLAAACSNDEPTRISTQDAESPEPGPAAVASPSPEAARAVVPPPPPPAPVVSPSPPVPRPSVSPRASPTPKPKATFTVRLVQGGGTIHNVRATGEGCAGADYGISAEVLDPQGNATGRGNGGASNPDGTWEVPFTLPAGQWSIAPSCVRNAPNTVVFKYTPLPITVP